MRMPAVCSLQVHSIAPTEDKKGAQLLLLGHRRLLRSDTVRPCVPHRHHIQTVIASYVTAFRARPPWFGCQRPARHSTTDAELPQAAHAVDAPSPGVTKERCTSASAGCTA